MLDELDQSQGQVQEQSPIEPVGKIAPQDSITPPVPAVTERLKDTPLGKGILRIVEEFERNDEAVRHRNVMKWRKHLYYWNSIQYLFESEVSKDWMTVNDLRDDPESDINPALYAKIINVYKANGEIIIGALTPNTPKVRYFPKDADDPDDVTTSKAFTKISELIQRHNKAQMLLMKAVFILYNQGLVACYNENKADYRFGQIDEDIYEDITVLDRDHYCPNCGTPLGGDSYQMGQAAPPINPTQCPRCGFQGPPEAEEIPRQDQQFKATKTKPKTRECLEVYGPLNVKIPMWAKDQQAVHILNLETEESIYTLRAIYPEFEKEIQGFSSSETWEQSARVPSNYGSDFPRDLCTTKRVWIKPKAYYLWESTTDEFKALSKYQDGLYCVIINGDLIVEVIKDKLDDHWTLSEYPMSESLHAEPLGSPMVPLQDMTNEVSNLSLETIEYGISEVFADKGVLDFDEYEQQEVKPGQITPAKAPAGQNLSSGFHELKPATMPEGIEMFAERLENVTQFVMGTYPSVFGGAMSEGGGTAREYEMSKSSALQRLSTVWNVLQFWWADLMGKSVKSFAKHMIGDENYVKAQGSNFMNVWIKKVELTGNIGDIVPEVSETLPVSWTQKRDILLNLMNMKDPNIATVLTHPENASLVASLLGVPELYIPGDDDRNKQLREIAEMLQAQPIPQPIPMGGPPAPPMGGGPPGPMSGSPPQMDGPPQPLGPEGPPPPPMDQSMGGNQGGMPSGQMGGPMGGPMGPEPPMMSSVPITPELDNHEVEAEVCKAWLKSEVGQDLKGTPGYANVLAHLKEHLMQIMMSAPPPEEEGGGASPKPKSLPPPDHLGDVDNKGVAHA
jgi:hypothetical protein